MDGTILSVVPARGGSKGIPRKNVREFGHKPLVGHAIETSIFSERIDHVVLTTDSQEIAQIGRRFGADTIIDRPKELATDEAPLAPVIEHAFEQVGSDYDYVLCFQPTVPLITADSIDEGITAGVQADSDSTLFVSDSTHHYWRETNDGFQAISSDRTNRQWMERIYKEIGVFLSDQTLVQEGKRVGSDPTFYTVEQWEGIDIDTYADWLTAESYLNRKRLLYRVIGSDENGTGHIYRGITIADHLFEHDISFGVGPDDDIAIGMLEESNYEYSVFESDDDFLSYVEDSNPSVVVNDILDTSAEYIQRLQKTGVRVVNFEDLGDGSEYADTVINALFEHSNPPANHHYGYEYFCLRNEFRYAEPKSHIPEVDRIMISFGGADISNLTEKTLEALSSVEQSLHLDVVLGLGYTERDSLEPVVQSLPSHMTIEVNQNVQSMARRMEQADLLITSNGRTLYEASALNLPVISIAQNSREQKHPYAHVSRGILSLGYAEYISESMIRDAVLDYITDGQKRENMRQALADHDIANGITRIQNIIFEKDDENR